MTAVRLTPAQARFGVQHAIDAVLELRTAAAPDEPAAPSWVDVQPVDVPDLRELVAVRFPGSMLVGPADPQDPAERPAIGIFVVLVNGEGVPVYVRHSAGGDVEVHRGEVRS